MFQLLLYVTNTDVKFVGKPAPYPYLFRKLERLSAKYPDRRYALRKA
jgi:hypothetical protein